MHTLFYIAEASQNGKFNFVSGKSNVSETEFWKEVERKCTDITLDRPEKREETMIKIREHLLEGKESNLTILDKYFERITK